MDPQTLDLIMEEEERKAWKQEVKEEGKFHKQKHMSLSVRRGRYQDAKNNMVRFTRRSKLD